MAPDARRGVWSALNKGCREPATVGQRFGVRLGRTVSRATSDRLALLPDPRPRLAMGGESLGASRYQGRSRTCRTGSASAFPPAGRQKPKEQHGHCLANVSLEFCFGYAWFLEIELVKLFLARHALHSVRRTDLGPASIGDAEQSNGTKHVWPKQRAVPSYCSSPVVPYNDSLLLAQGVDQADHISRQLEYVIGVDGRWLIGEAVTALIRRNYVVPCICQRW